MAGQPALRPTRLGLLPLVAAGALGGLAVVTGDSWLVLLAAGCIGLAVGARVLRPRLDTLQVAVSVPSRVTVGDDVSSSLHVRNTGRRAVPLTRLVHHVDGLDDVTVVVDALPPGACAGATVVRKATARGAATQHTVDVVSTAPLGLLVATARVVSPADLLVQPAVHRTKAPPPSGGDDGTGLPVRSRTGVDVHGIREWRRGDDLRQVHWRSTARRGQLVVLEREEPRGGRLSICVVGPDGTPDWEPLVSAVASLAVATTRSGRAVRLLAVEPRDPTWRELVTVQEQAVLDWCTHLRHVLPPDPTTLARLAAHVGPGELTVALTRPAAGWWDPAARACTGAGIRFVPLVVTTRAPEPAP